MTASFLKDVSCEMHILCYDGFICGRCLMRMAPSLHNISKQISVAVSVNRVTFWCRSQTVQQINGYHHHHLRRCLLPCDLHDRELRGGGDVRAEIRSSEGDDAGHVGEDSGRRSSSSIVMPPHPHTIGVADLSVVCRLQQDQG